jgi:acid phosphatase
VVSPEILFNSVTSNPDRLAKIKNTTMFYSDLAANKLPQWMFITPNMTDDGHDTSVTFAGVWLRNFLGPLLNDKNFMQGTLVMITFDENETYPTKNRILGILLGDAVPESLVGTTDDNFYDHYSEISTVEANWDLYTLGRWDVGANVYSWVAKKTGDHLRKWSGNPSFSQMYFNFSYPGIFNSETWASQPMPNIHSRRNGRTVLPAIKETWKGVKGLTYYNHNHDLEIPDGYHIPKYVSA